MTANSLIALIEMGQREVKKSGETWVISRQKHDNETKLSKHKPLEWPCDEYVIMLSKDGNDVAATLSSHESENR
ncbi:hypothetical protein [Armatimonas sp.]|uniref:hypothetical protein n=1 Tax=Armatimonas sp. TaxID=1872638 RepID=UPI00286C6685|nr:hypothetical protein [Armatimonas sp.]